MPGSLRSSYPYSNAYVTRVPPDPCCIFVATATPLPVEPFTTAEIDALRHGPPEGLHKVLAALIAEARVRAGAVVLPPVGR